MPVVRHSKKLLGLCAIALLPTVGHAQTTSTVTQPSCADGHSVSVEINRLQAGIGYFAVAPITGASARSVADGRAACKKLGDTLKIKGLDPRLISSDIHASFGTSKHPITTTLPTDPKAQRKAIADQWPAKFTITGTALFCCIERP